MLIISKISKLIFLAACFSYFIESEAGIEKYFKKIENKSSIHSMQNIDFVYLINLDKRPDRYERTINVLKPYGIYPCRFSAVNGWELSAQALGELGVIYEPGMPHGPICSVYRHEDGKEFISFEIMKEAGIAYYSHSLSRGAIGCLLSHLSILQDAYDSGYNTVWIMEDDIKIKSNPNEISSLVSTLDTLAPDWDILFTDNEVKGGNGQPVPCMMIRPRPLVQLKPLEYYLQRTPVTSDIVKIGMRFGSVSMVVRRSGMKKILDFFKTKKVYFPYDIDYFLVPDIHLYALKRDIVTNIADDISDNGTPSYLEKEKK